MKMLNAKMVNWKLKHSFQNTKQWEEWKYERKWDMENPSKRSNIYWLRVLEGNRENK